MYKKKNEFTKWFTHRYEIVEKVLQRYFKRGISLIEENLFER